MQAPAPLSVGGAGAYVSLRPPAGWCSRCRHRVHGLLGADLRVLGEGAPVAAIFSCEPHRCFFNARGGVVTPAVTRSPGLESQGIR